MRFDYINTVEFLRQTKLTTESLASKGNYLQAFVTGSQNLRHKLYPPVKRLSYFTEDRKKVVLAEREVPEADAVQDQLNQTEYYKFFERNAEEHVIYKRFLQNQDPIYAEETMLEIRDELNRELGYVSFSTFHFLV